MRPFSLYAALLVAGLVVSQSPALGQSYQTPQWHGQDERASRGDASRRERRHRGDLEVLAVEPYRLGPAPTGFWYRCDAPQGYYPYIPACRTPWRMVPSGPPR